uniref:Uncharacterized protein n=1 Tax=Solanum tuberosum TaxID=4113 RepID=M1DS83_SOLTU
MLKLTKCSLRSPNFTNAGHQESSQKARRLHLGNPQVDSVDRLVDSEDRLVDKEHTPLGSARAVEASTSRGPKRGLPSCQRWLRQSSREVYTGTGPLSRGLPLRLNFLRESPRGTFTGSEGSSRLVNPHVEIAFCLHG